MYLHVNKITVYILLYILYMFIYIYIYSLLTLSQKPYNSDYLLDYPTNNYYCTGVLQDTLLRTPAEVLKCNDLSYMCAGHLQGFISYYVRINKDKITNFLNPAKYK